MTDEQTLRLQVETSLKQYYSQVQLRHRDQRDRIAKVAAQLCKTSAQLDKARSALLKSHHAELDSFREMMRLIDWKIESAEQSPDNETETNLSAAVDE